MFSQKGEGIVFMCLLLFLCLFPLNFFQCSLKKLVFNKNHVFNKNRVFEEDRVFDKDRVSDNNRAFEDNLIFNGNRALKGKSTKASRPSKNNDLTIESEKLKSKSNLLRLSKDGSFKIMQLTDLHY
eukprot:Awhi_evm1s15591